MDLGTDDASGNPMVAQIPNGTTRFQAWKAKYTEERRGQALEISKGTVNVLMLSFTAKVTFI